MTIIPLSLLIFLSVIFLSVFVSGGSIVGGWEERQQRAEAGASADRKQGGSRRLRRTLSEARDPAADSDSRIGRDPAAGSRGVGGSEAGGQSAAEKNGWEESRSPRIGGWEERLGSLCRDPDPDQNRDQDRNPFIDDHRRRHGRLDAPAPLLPIRRRPCFRRLDLFRSENRRLDLLLPTGFFSAADCPPASDPPTPLLPPAAAVLPSRRRSTHRRRRRRGR